MSDPPHSVPTAGPIGIGVVVLCHHSAAALVDVLERIPLRIGDAPAIVLVADGSSDGRCADLAEDWARTARLDVDVDRRPPGLGHGGNQKASLRWAAAMGLDVVAFVDGDGEYPPELLRDLVAPIVEGRADVVSGSRMVIPGSSRGGVMRIDHLVADRALKPVLNRLAAARFTEWFSGFRAYRVAMFGPVDLDSMSNGFDFDAEIVFRLLEWGARVNEIAIPASSDAARAPLLRTGILAIARGISSYRRRLTLASADGRPVAE